MVISIWWMKSNKCGEPAAIGASAPPPEQQDGSREVMKRIAIIATLALLTVGSSAQEPWNEALLPHDSSWWLCFTASNAEKYASAPLSTSTSRYDVVFVLLAPRASVVCRHLDAIGFVGWVQIQEEQGTTRN